MKVLDLLEERTKQFKVTIKDRLTTRVRDLDENKLQRLSASFMTPAQKKQATKLDVDESFSYTVSSENDDILKVSVKRVS